MKKATHHKDNLSRDERDFIHSLSQRDDIVIPRADKGGGVVVWGKVDYIDEPEKQLSDESFYKYTVP